MKKSLILLVAVLAFNSYAYATDNLNSTYPDTLINRVVTVPAKATFKGIFLSALTSETANIGQEVLLALGSDFVYNGKLIAPAGSTISGTVIEVAKAKHGSIGAKITLRFTAIMTPSGQNIPISAIIDTDDNSGTLVGGTKLYPQTGSSVDTISATDIANHPVSKFSLGKGAIIINEVGTSGGGLIKSIWDKGEEVEIPINASVNLILTQPITVNPTSDEN